MDRAKRIFWGLYLLWISVHILIWLTNSMFNLKINKYIWPSGYYVGKVQEKIIIDTIPPTLDRNNDPIVEWVHKEYYTEESIDELREILYANRSKYEDALSKMYFKNYRSQFYHPNHFISSYYEKYGSPFPITKTRKEVDRSYKELVTPDYEISDFLLYTIAPVILYFVTVLLFPFKKKEV